MTAPRHHDTEPCPDGLLRQLREALERVKERQREREDC
jgi:hypothetical protein